ncbi:MAG TPA: Gfo/Idh/MocA family oxidoreductase [Firmicutes bacterium]|nr:Gfo/Idh/MocA family oxidoreductase [Bacillota bacterium]
MIPFGIIGTGKITRTFLEAVQSVPELTLRAVYSRSLEKAQSFGEEYGAKVFTDSLEDLAADRDVQAVYIASPNCCHCEQAIRMMDAGKHVLCEKPAASNQEEYQRMLEAARRNGVVFFEAMRPAFTPEMAMVEETLPRLGKIRQASFSFCQYSSRYDNFKNGMIENAFRPELSNGSLMDIGVYCIHWMVRLFGMPESLQASPIFLENGVDGAGAIIGTYPDMQVQLLYSKICDGHTPSEIQGENGSLLMDTVSQPQKLTLCLRGQTPEALPVTPCANNMVYEARRWAQWITRGPDRELFRVQDDTMTELRVLDKVRALCGIRFPADERGE